MEIYNFMGIDKWAIKDPYQIKCCLSVFIDCLTEPLSGIPLPYYTIVKQGENTDSLLSGPFEP